MRIKLTVFIITLLSQDTRCIVGKNNYNEH